jgi:hypothetical protein
LALILAAAWSGPIPVSHPAAPSTWGWLKQFNRVAGWILEQDLLPARTGDYVISEAHPCPAQTRNFSIDVVDQEVYAIPAAWAGLPAIGHRSSSRAGAAAEQQPQIAASYVGERWPLVRQKGESEMCRIEGHGGRDVVDHVAHVDGVSVLHQLVSPPE